MRLLLVVIYLYNQAQNADKYQAELKQLRHRHRTLLLSSGGATRATSSLIGGARTACRNCSAESMMLSWGQSTAGAGKSQAENPKVPLDTAARGDV